MITHNEKYSLTPRCLIIVSLTVSLLIPSLAGCSEGIHQSPTILNFHQVESWLYRGGRPDAEGIRMLRSIGIRTIVTLERGWFEREPQEVQKERQLAEQGGIQFIHVPLHPFFKPRSEEIRKILSIVMEPARHPVFIHCRKGKDRTGIIIAVFRVRYQNWAVQRAYEELESFGHRRILLFWWKNVLPEDAYDNFRNIGSIGGSFLFKTVLGQKGSLQAVLYA
jgi:tyrosine-protein phosphatase SIW14